ncbi:SCO family protein [Devosia limi]|uniref:Protein SCO1/2 n=2 Tax=Devosia limi DSM 17137 TaxID=1121477 RepID=A0A1M5CK47_9HYPH|nr:SCO family protein [Devosia limi]SHF55079.1 protein SCO1/2 [Devosia limi DSM 17137]
MATEWKNWSRRIRMAGWAAVAFVVVAVGVGWAVTNFGPQSRSNEPKPYAAAFSLVDQDGKPVTQADFLGKPSAWFFGFTNCPDVCPTALAEMSAILESLGDDAQKLQVVFVSVDPERDTPEILKDYAGYFDPRIVALTGSQENISSMTKARYIYSEKIPLEGGNYTMQHSAGVQLVAPDGGFWGTLDSEENFDIRLGKVRRLIQGA